jgi:4-hydroxybenzoate polyprenyltransferase
LNSIIRFLVLSNIYVSLCVAALALSTQFVLSSFNLDVVFFLFFATFISYNFHKIVSLKRNPDRAQAWFFNNKKFIYFLLLCSLIISIIFFLGFNYETQFLIIIISFISLMYPFGLRSVPYIKVFVIALVWCVSTEFITIFENKLVIETELLMSIFSRFFFIVAITIPFDIRDVEVDFTELKTLPIVFGIKKSKQIALVTLYIYVLIEVLRHLVFTPNSQFLVASFLCCIYTRYLIKGSDNKKLGFYYVFWVESSSLSVLFFLIITSIFL